MTPIFSVVTIMRDEARSLPGLAESLRDFLALGGDWICYDTGSTDGSAVLAVSLGANCVGVGEKHLLTVTDKEAEAINAPLLANGEEPVVSAGDRVFDFAGARNAAANVAANDWIMYLDADERLNGDLAAIQKEMTVGRGLLRTWISAGTTKWLTTRIYNRRRYYFEGLCHEGLYAMGESYESTIPEGSLLITHQQLHKDERPTRIKGLALQAHRDSAPRWQHYYGRELAWRGRPKTAIKVLEAHAARRAWIPEAAESLAIAGDCYAALGNDVGADIAWHKCYLTDRSRRVGLMRTAEVAYRTADWPVVVSAAGLALSIPYSGAYIENMAEYGSRPHELLYPALWQTGDIEGSKKHYAEAKRLNPTDQKIREDSRWYEEPLVSVCIPALGRPEKLERLTRLMSRQTYPSIEVIVQHDSFEDRQGCPRTLAKAVEHANGDLIAFLGQDTIPADDYIEKAVAKMRECFPLMDGFVGTDDGVWGEKMATHWLASKKLLPALGGYFFHPDYEHCFCDEELRHRVQAMGKYAYAPDAKLVHDNPVVTGEAWDDVMKIAYDKERQERDRRTFERRKAVWSLPFTGERVVPDKMQGYEPTLEEHVARYKWARGLVGGVVLDAPCGTGYGTAIMGMKAYKAIRVDGCDVSPEAVGYAAAKRPDINYFIANLEKPEMAGEYDTVVSFEGIEHLSDPRPFLRWAKSHAKRMIWSIPVNNPSQFHKAVYSVADIKELMEGELGKDVEYFSQTGTEIKPMAEGEVPTFVLGISRWA